MVPPAPVLTNKKPGRHRGVFTMLLAVWMLGLAGCSPPGPRALLQGKKALDEGRTDEAVPLLERAVGRDPKLLPAQAALGRAYLEAGEMAKAIAPLKAALETDADGSLHFQLARAYRATGQADLASQALAQFQEMRKSAEAEAQSLREEFQILPPQ